MPLVRAIVDLLICLVGFAIGLAALQLLQEAGREIREQRKYNEKGPGVAESGGPAKNTP